MFNYQRVADLANSRDREIALANCYKADANRLSTLISRAVFILVPFSENRAGTDAETLVRYVEKLEKAAKDESVRKDRELKERQERWKIEQIVLDLKNRKWEPAE